MAAAWADGVPAGVAVAVTSAPGLAGADCVDVPVSCGVGDAGALSLGVGVAVGLSVGEAVSVGEALSVGASLVVGSVVPEPLSVGVGSAVCELSVDVDAVVGVADELADVFGFEGAGTTS